ncbi:MAG: HNH endonuclease [Zoogloeaceae bacterium]|jgi:hypothetical protein|nr:HNH endonuclease [Zoogloeaceae bacterium]
MKRLNPPVFASAQAVEACASGIADTERADALRQALPAIEIAERAYQALAPSGELYRMDQTGQVTALISAELMSTIYKRHFARAGSPSRLLYEQIRMAPEHGICPLCGQRVVASVDHYLPKSHYPQLTLTPINLVPACSDCNKNKLAQVPRNAQEQSLHPYFDDLGNERWLVAEVRPSTPPTISFGIRPPTAWPEVLTARVAHHFATMGLAELYAAQAASELADISYLLADVGGSAGPDGVRAHLERELQSRAARDANSWKTALYEALACSDWFCAEGYRQIQSLPVPFP